MTKKAADQIIGELFASYPAKYVDGNILNAWVRRIRSWNERAAMEAVATCCTQPQMPSWGVLRGHYRAAVKRLGLDVIPPSRRLEASTPMTPEESDDLKRRIAALKEKLGLPDEIKDMRVSSEETQKVAAEHEQRNIRAQNEARNQEHGDGTRQHVQQNTPSPPDEE